MVSDFVGRNFNNFSFLLYLNLSIFLSSDLKM